MALESLNDMTAGQSNNNVAVTVLTQKQAVLKALRLASLRRLDEAEAVLNAIGVDNLSASGFDAMARIALLKGDFVQCVSLWRSAASLDSSSPTIRAAVETLQSPWLLYAVVRRLILLALLPMLACALFWFIAYQRQCQSPTLVPGHFVQAEASSSVDMLSAPDTTTQLASSADAQVVRNTDFIAPAPLLRLTNSVVRTTGEEVVIVFNEGLFAYRCELTERANQFLLSMGEALAECPPIKTLQIEGHTDSSPLPPGGQFEDNYALGLARAATVAHKLTQVSKVSPAVISTSSSGSAKPPFPVDSYDSDLRNRTAVLSITFYPVPKNQKSERIDQ